MRILLGKWLSLRNAWSKFSALETFSLEGGLKGVRGGDHIRSLQAVVINPYTVFCFILVFEIEKQTREWKRPTETTAFPRGAILTREKDHSWDLQGLLPSSHCAYYQLLLVLLEQWG